MTEKGMLFSAPMVRAIIAGDKRRTRRIIKPQPVGHLTARAIKPPYQEGDRIWVRETLKWAGEDRWVYGADGVSVGGQIWAKRKTVSSIHMPRWASRIAFTIDSVSVERLQDITEDDARLEGIGEPYLGDADPPWEEQAIMVSRRKQFRNLWIDLNGQESWDANPWVFVYGFKDVEVGIGASA